MNSYIKFFDKWYIITINNKNDERITNNLRSIDVSNFEILRYEPAKKIDNVNKNSSLLQLFSHNSWDETSENIYQNHLSTIERGILENRKNIVILEDDAEIILKPNKLKKLVKWLDNNEWDISF
jgi:hypothetical protein